MKTLVVSLTFLLSSSAWASFQSGISFEMAIGFPQMSASLGSTDARYNGFSVQGALILPLLDYENSFSVDLTTGYRYASYQNSASTVALAEWAQLQGFAPGFRFNLKYFFLGSEINFLSGRHLVSGSTSQINDYSINPIQAYIGANLPIGKNTSLAASYSQYIAKGRADINSQELSVSEQVFMVTIQIDMGIGFFNVLKDDSAFELHEDHNFDL